MQTRLAIVLAAVAFSTGIAPMLCSNTVAAQTVTPAPNATVEHVTDGTYRLSWPGWNAMPVDVFVSDSANAPVAARRQLVKGSRENVIELKLPSASRPYFYLQPLHGKGVWVAERLLPLEGGRNFRDLGGYQTADGHSVRWGKIYRSGTMTSLTPTDYEYLGRLGIRTVCDLRTTKERISEPNKWAEAARINYWTRDYEMSGADLRGLFNMQATEDDARNRMITTYRKLPYEQAPAYRAMFRQLVDGQAPLAFNCSAGKDRAGLAAALVLTALGVPQQTVFADYTLTNRYLPEALAREKTTDPLLTALPKRVADAVLAADPAYIAAAFDEMTRRSGSPQRYLRDVIGLDASAEAELRKLLLE